MKITYTNEEEYQALIDRLDKIGFRWNTGHKLKELYPTPPERREVSSLIPMICTSTYSDWKGKPAIMFGNYIEDYEEISTVKFLLDKPFNYALTVMREIK